MKRKVGITAWLPISWGIRKKISGEKIFMEKGVKLLKKKPCHPQREKIRKNGGGGGKRIFLKIYVHIPIYLFFHKIV